MDISDRAIAQHRQKRDFGQFAPEGTSSVHYLGDRKQRDGFYFYNVPVEEHPAFKGLFPNYENGKSGRLQGFSAPGSSTILYTAVYRTNGQLSHFIDADGVEYSGFGRAYVDEQQEEHDLGPAYTVNYMSEKGAQVLINDMMPRADFTNAHLQEEPLSRDGSIKQFAVVAEKSFRA